MVLHETIEVRTDAEIGIYDITGRLEKWVQSQQALEGQLLVLSRHTTTALAINEFEPELLTDIKNYLSRLVPRNAPPDAWQTISGPELLDRGEDFVL